MEAKHKANWKTVTVAQLKLTTAKLANWKSPGPDQVQNFWLKYLTALHLTLARVCNVVQGRCDRIRGLFKTEGWDT